MSSKAWQDSKVVADSLFATLPKDILVNLAHILCRRLGITILTKGMI